MLRVVFLFNSMFPLLGAISIMSQEGQNWAYKNLHATRLLDYGIADTKISWNLLTI